MRVSDLAIEPPLGLKIYAIEDRLDGQGILPALGFSTDEAAHAARKRTSPWVALYSPLRATFVPAEVPSTGTLHSGCIHALVKLSRKICPLEQVVPRTVADEMYVNRDDLAAPPERAADRWKHAVVLAGWWDLDPPVSLNLVWPECSTDKVWPRRAGSRVIDLPESTLYNILFRDVVRRQITIPDDIPHIYRNQLAKVVDVDLISPSSAIDDLGPEASSTKELVAELERRGYTVERVEQPDSVYIIVDPQRPNMVKVGSGTGDVSDRLTEAKRWTAGDAKLVRCELVGKGRGLAVERWVHDELKRAGLCVHGEWFRATPDQVHKRIITGLSRAI